MARMADTQRFSLNPSIAIIISGVIIAGAIIYINKYPAAPIVEGAGLPTAVNVPAPKAGDHILGSPTAPIVLVEYSDFECYYCAQAYPTFKRLVEESNGEVAWVMRNFPLESIHPQARGAARAAECIASLVGNDAYWKYADAVFANQGGLSPLYSRALALQYGADAAAYDQCVASGQYDALIDAQAGEALSAGGTGTPFTVVWSQNYQAPISGALPYEQFKAVIQSVKARQ